MKMMTKVAALSALMLMSSGSSVQAKYQRVCDGFLPPNNLSRFDNIHSLAGLTEEGFNQKIDEVLAVYSPIVSTYGANLSAERNWNDSTVNAYADQSGSSWVVHMFGGLARRPEITLDGFTMVMCHELGHHLGGYPYYHGGFLNLGTGWAATEGQADYFATQACAKQIWADQKDTNASFRATVQAVAKSKCDAAYSGVDAQNLCYRTAMAGQSLAKLLAALETSAEPKFDTPDPSVVAKTFEAHPAGQCRLDTYLNGAICSKEFDRLVIPAKNGKKGSNNNAAEVIADKYECGGAAGSAPGVRPACWFKSRIH